MQKFVQQETAHKINHILKHPDLPPLNTLRQVSNVVIHLKITNELRNLLVIFFISLKQGVIVLSRQWKNMLYNPMLFEHQYKNKLLRPLNVTFAVPQSEEVNPLFLIFHIVRSLHLNN